MTRFTRRTYRVARKRAARVAADQALRARILKAILGARHPATLAATGRAAEAVLREAVTGREARVVRRGRREKGLWRA